MADLLDIAPSTAVEVVKIDGRRIIVRGLHGNAIASIVARFPELGLLLGGGSANIGPRLIERFGDAIGPIIAAGCGHLGDEKYEQHAGTLLVEDQLKLLTAIIGLTFPKGMTSFIGTVTALLSGAGEGGETRQSAIAEIAIAITALIRRGFPPDYAMSLTPRQIAAYLEFNDKLDRIDRANALTIAAIGAQGDSKTVEKTVREFVG